ncbi:MAG: TetR/AcrR family transcriptional regulator [Deltaproteobacteria bacterium]|nr:TetR/AcrR family transcriptional regulator [Deltaproteobacteria bacterium]MBW2103591.1 TetR/AcrR family transcriptional regulator [Deltaproteobacteria bacterium]
MKRSEKTEKRIMQAALELFVRKGYHGTSIQDITRKVGMTKGALYTHFRSKGELLLRIVEEYRSRFLGEMMRKVSAHGGTPLDKLHCIISFNSRFALENQHMCVALTFFTTELNADEEFGLALKGVYQTYHRFVSQLIRQGVAEGVFRQDLDPDLTALTFMALHDGVLHQWVLNRFHVDGKQYVRTFRSVFMQGVTA